MARIIALANQKGGVAKTSSTINLGAALVERGRRVLVVDLDPQASLTAALGIDPPKLQTTMYDVLVQGVPLSAIVLAAEGLQVTPSSVKLSEGEYHLVNQARREYVLSEALTSVSADYDDILLDCPPSLGLLTINALTAADAVIIPLECTYLALRGLDQLLDTITNVRERSNPQLDVLGVLPTMYDRRNAHEREVLGAVMARFPNQVYPPIPRTTRFRESTVAGQPLLSYESSNPGAVAYRTLAARIS